MFGTKYSRGCVVVTGLDHGQPTFGEVSKIIFVTGKIVLQYTTLHVVEFSQHLNAYQVKKLNDVKGVQQEHLQDFHPLGTHRGFGQNENKLFVVLRYRVDYML